MNNWAFIFKIWLHVYSECTYVYYKFNFIKCIIYIIMYIYLYNVMYVHIFYHFSVIWWQFHFPQDTEISFWNILYSTCMFSLFLTIHYTYLLHKTLSFICRIRSSSFKMISNFYFICCKHVNHVISCEYV